MHLCKVVGFFQCGGNFFVNYPFPVKDIVAVHRVAVEPRSFAPLQTGFLAHDALTGIELFKQAANAAGQIVVSPERYYRRSVDVHIFVAERAGAAAQHEVRGCPAFAGA